MKITSVTKETGSRARWMIVDENDDILLVIRDILARLGEVEVECFNSPQAALTAFGAKPEAYEFVITDLQMPGADEEELASRLRPLSPPLQILLSTGSDLLSNEEAVEKGFCQHLHKSFPFAALQRALAPAALKYLEIFPGLSQGLKLVHANDFTKN